MREAALVTALENIAAAAPIPPSLRLFRGVEASAGNLWMLSRGLPRRGGYGQGHRPALFGHVAGAGAAHFNLYMPHWKTQG